MGRTNSRRPVNRQKSYTNHMANKNFNSLASNSDYEKVVPKRVGGGYSSITRKEQAKLHQSQNASGQNRSKVQNNKEKITIQYLPSGKRKSCEDLSKSEINKFSTKSQNDNITSPSTYRPNRLIRKKSEHQNLNQSELSSNSQLKKTKSPTYKYMRQIKKQAECESCHNLNPSEQCASCRNSLEPNSNNKNLNKYDRLSGKSQINNDCELKIEDLASDQKTIVSVRNKRMSTDNPSKDKALLPTSSNSSNHKFVKKNSSKLQMNYEKALGEIQSLKAEQNKLKLENSDCKKVIETLLSSNIQLQLSLQKSNSMCSISVKNYFDFIEVFKTLQNTALNEDEVSIIRLKFDEITSSKTNKVFDFNYEQLHSSVDQTNKLLSNVKLEMSELTDKLSSLGVDSTSLIQSFTDTIKINTEEDDMNMSLERGSDLDDLLFNSHR